MIPWVLTSTTTTPTPTTLTVDSVTNIQDHLFMCWQYFPPVRVPIYRTRRGVTRICGYYYSWTDPHFREQTEDDDTFIHTFFEPLLTRLATIWFYIWSPRNPNGRQIQGPLMHVTLPAGVTLFEHYNTGDNTEDCMWSLWWFAQTFTPEITHTIAALKLRLYRIGTPGLLTASITNAIGDQPTGDDLCLGTTDANTLPDARPGEWRTILLSPPTLLQANVKVAIVLKTPDCPIGNRMCWRMHSDTPAYDRGLFLYKRTTEETWYEWPESDTMFEEWGY